MNTAKVQKKDNRFLVFVVFTYVRCRPSRTVRFRSSYNTCTVISKYSTHENLEQPDLNRRKPFSQHLRTLPKVVFT